ncbi:hypothetical protein INR49_002223 [Caranx melampygus]|nr:hypothetical protein INR49_002223 [Caranx melampygus]
MRVMSGHASVTDFMSCRVNEDNQRLWCLKSKESFDPAPRSEPSETRQTVILILPDLQMEFRPCRTTPVNRVRWMASTSSHWFLSL